MSERPLRKFIGIASMIFFFFTLVYMTYFRANNLTFSAVSIEYFSLYVFLIYFLPLLVIGLYMIFSNRKDKGLGVILIFYMVFSLLLMVTPSEITSAPDQTVQFIPNWYELSLIFLAPARVITLLVIFNLSFISWIYLFDLFYLFGLYFKEKPTVKKK